MARIFATLLCLLVVLAGSPLRAQAIDDCLVCHDDTELTKNRDGRVVSLFVDLGKFETSVHGQEGFACVDCHTDLEGFDGEHDETLAPVDCAMCHDREQKVFAQSLHGRQLAAGDTLAPHCWDCHGAHEILPPSNPDSRVNRFNIPLMCGNCHKEGAPVARFYDLPQDSVLAHYRQSIHGEGLFKRGLTISAVCIDCHTAHDVRDHNDPKSSIFRDNVATTCQKCHGRIEAVHQKVIAGELWEREPDKVPACIECHQPHSIRRVFYDEGVSNQECLACHGKPDLTTERDGQTISLYVDASEYHDSVHRNTTCAQCHTGATPNHKERACATVSDQVDCSICHADQVNLFNESTHGTLLARGDQDAPRCVTCHGTHGVRAHTDPASPSYVSNIAGMCATCHGTGGKADLRYEGVDKGMVENYAASVHGQAVQKSGLVVSATCTDCHTSHHMLPADDIRSTINRASIAGTCAKCHEGILEEFKTSIHFTGEAPKGERLPMCNDCHSSHEITKTDAQGFMREIVSTCGHCHEDVTESYFETFHGKVVKLGYTDTAKCQDCHGAHNILPPSDRNSTLSRENIVATCAQCHSGSHRQFAGYLTHATHHDKDKYPFIHYTWLFMTALLVGTFIFFGIHTLLWLPRSIQALRHSRQLRAVQDPNAKQFRRFKRLPRYLHILVIVSFLSLAVTGMTLKFSYFGWAQAISHALGGFEGTGTIHRLAAAVTFFYFTRHVIDLFSQKRRSGKSWKAYITDPDSMLPNARDGKEFVQTVKWFVGLGPRPQYGRWTYWEKFDYFAVFWGVAMIGFSGLVLWFPELFTRLLPGSFINVATIIHSDEALLATGFIFTIHFFNTHFRPDRFPMDPVIFTGRMSLEEFKEDRPREYEAMVKSGELEQHLVEPLDPHMVKALKIFGFSALFVGLSLIVMIIWAVLFGYK
ncbi:MAG: cytochrome c3 family protein [Candidatus Krumholzibacteriia bacterium]